MNIAQIVARLGARRCGSGWVARCPAHKDRSPSLSIREGQGGRILVHCFAGCDTGAVLHAVGLSWRDILPPRAPVSRVEVERQLGTAERADRAAFEIFDRIRRLRCYYRNCLLRVQILQRRIGEDILTASSATELECGWGKLARLAPVATLYLAGFTLAFTGIGDDPALLTRFALASPKERRVIIFGDQSND